MWWLILLVVVAGAGYYGLRYLFDRLDPADDGTGKNPYHCVTIERGWFACSGVDAVGERRYLSNDAPRLPLPGCSLQRCQCRYVHHEDRRVEERRTPYGTAGANAERRRSDRRQVPHQYAL